MAVIRHQYVDPHSRRSEGSQLLLHPLPEACDHRGASGQHDVGRQVSSNVQVALSDAVPDHPVDASGLHPDQLGLEEGLRTPKALVAQGDDLAVGHLVGDLKLGAVLCLLQLRLEVERQVAALLLDVPHDFPLRRRLHGGASLAHEFHEVRGQVATSQVHAVHGVRHAVALVDGHHVRHAIADVADDACGPARSVEREHRLRGHVHGRDVECLEHDLSHPFSIGLGVQRRLRQHDGMILRLDTKAMVETMVPDLLHVLPILHDAMLDGV
mmetsp:Transcript_44151/g.111817  ORF Transcript_44151/g.111817 Transcript_44151/m.111817 type:complete len:269 (-) Transcript_44151:203-1009(-)